MAISAPDVITRYFAAQAARDFDTLVTLFADDAIVIDEGKSRRGTKEIRAWRENVASVHEYTTDLVGVETADEGEYVARVHLEGNFPGGTGHVLRSGPPGGRERTRAYAADRPRRAHALAAVLARRASHALALPAMAGR